MVNQLNPPSLTGPAAQAQATLRPGISFEQIQITPAMAKRLLATNARSIDSREQRNAISNYAQMMRHDAWVLNGQPIIMAEDGSVLDGLLRLSAAVASGQSFQTIIARNIRADTLHTIDQHRRRLYQGVLEARGIANAGTIVRMMGKLIRIENGQFGALDMPISWARYDRVLDANPDLHRAAVLANAQRGTLLHSTARPVLAFMALRAGYETELQRFLREMGPDHVLGLESPPRMLALQSQLMRDNGHAYDTDTALGLAILAFNDFVAGRTVSGHYQWRPSPPEAQTASQTPPHAANRGLPELGGYPGLHHGQLSDHDSAFSPLETALHAASQAEPGRVYVQMKTVTPAMARRWLGFNQRNRRLQQGHIQAIRRDILAGHWMLNAQPISFTANPEAANGPAPQLLNGQHRLHAIVAADVAVEVPIAWGIAEAAFSTYDTHARRNAVANTGLRLDARVISAAARLQWRQDQGLPLTGGRGASPTASELIATVQAHPGLEAPYARARRKGLIGLASAGVMTYFIYRVQSERPDLAEVFLQGLESGTDLGPGNPLLKLRQALADARGSLRRAEVISVLLAGWQAYLEWPGAGAN